jgi:CTP:molybdopterin cytidylyltransferase MocA
MKITLVLALLGVATFAATLIWLHLQENRRRTVVVVLGPTHWAVERQPRAKRHQPHRNPPQARAMPRLRVVA